MAADDRRNKGRQIQARERLLMAVEDRRNDTRVDGAFNLGGARPSAAPREVWQETEQRLEAQQRLLKAIEDRRQVGTVSEEVSEVRPCTSQRAGTVSEEF